MTNGQQVPDTGNDVVDGQEQQDLNQQIKLRWYPQQDHTLLHGSREW